MTAAFERELIRRAIAGEGECFSRLMSPLLPGLRAAASRVVPACDCADAVQETTLKALVHLKSFRFQCRFSTWLHAILKNEICLYWRRRRRLVSLETLMEEQGASVLPGRDADQYDGLARRENSRRLRRLVGQLPVPLAEVLVLHHLKEMSPDETAAQLGLTIPAFKMRLFRGRQRLKSLWRGE